MVTMHKIALFALLFYVRDLSQVLHFPFCPSVNINDPAVYAFLYQGINLFLNEDSITGMLTIVTRWICIGNMQDTHFCSLFFGMVKIFSYALGQSLDDDDK